MSEEVEHIETEEEEQPITIGSEDTERVVDELEEEFEKFNKTNSEHKPEENSSTDSGDPTEIDLSMAENFKLQLFMGFMFELIDGIHVFLYGFMTRHKLTKEDISLDEDDKEGLQMYFRTERVMNLINRIPAELMGFIHMEYLYFNKFREFKKHKDVEEPEEEEVETEEAEHEEVVEVLTTEEKIEKIFNKKKEEFAKKESTNTTGDNTKPPKKAAPKKSDAKQAPKKAAKKAAPKKAAKKAAKKVVTKKEEEKK